MSTATLEAVPCRHVKAHLPAWGLWFADCSLDRDATLAGRVTLQIADLTMRGTVVSGGSWLGRSSYRIVGGAGGWGKPLPARSYQDDAGVRASKILGDAAAECGETLEGAPTGVVGPAWDRAASTASFAPNTIAPQAWYVDVDGLTRFGKRAARALAVEATRGRVDLAAGFVELMADSIASILPGVIVDGREAVDVVHELDATKLRSTVWLSVAPTSKRAQLYAKLQAQVDPWARYRATYEYRIVSQAGERLDLQPVRASLGMPDLRAVRVSPGVPGVKAEHTLGALCRVRFVNADPARPEVCGFDDADAEGFTPESLTARASSIMFATNGYPTEHATSAESLVAALVTLLVPCGYPLTTPAPAPVPLVAPPGSCIPVLLAAISAATLDPASLAMLLAQLALKTDNPTGASPGLGWPNVRGS